MFAASKTAGVSAVTQAEAVDFDGTNDYLLANSLTGATESKTFTFSAWVWTDTNDATDYILSNWDGANGDFYVFILNTGEVSFVARNTSNTIILQGTSSVALPLRTWSNLQISIDLASTSNRYVAINDVIDSSVTWSTYSNQTIDFTASSWNISQTGAGGSRFEGRLSNVFLDYTYRDLSITANRRLFVTADLKPAANQAALNPILYLPMSDPTTVGTNAGTGGNFTLTGTVARSGRGPNQYNAPYSTFDGSADYLSRTTAPTGIADSSTFTIAFSFTPNSTTAGQRMVVFASSTSARFDVVFSTTDLSVSARNTSTQILSTNTTGVTFVVGRNYNVVVSVDLTDTAKRYIYINGSAVSSTWSTYTSGSINFNISTTPRYYIGTGASTTSWYNGKLGALWFNTSYIDLSVASNLAKFVSGTGIDAKPVDLGASGELPTGTSPLIYLPMYGNNAGKNYGTGGDFTVNSGPYTGARGPNEYWASAVGNSGYLYRDTPLSGATDTKTLTFFALFKPTSINVTRSFWFTAGSASSAFRGQLQVKAGNGFSIAFTNSAGVFVLNATVTDILIDSTTKTYAIHCCIDLSDTAKRAIYINGVAATVTWTTYTNDTMNFSAQRSAFGAEWGTTWTGSLLRGNLGGFYLANTYIDFTQESNRLLFADAFNYATNLPAAITANTVPNPLVYMLFDPANNGANSGTGGNYTNSSMSDGGQL